MYVRAYTCVYARMYYIAPTTSNLYIYHYLETKN